MSREKNNAIVSVYDKRDLDQLTRGLADLDWRLFASGGTANAMRATGAEVGDVSILSKGQEILGGRVKTLSREVSGGLLAKDTPEDWADLESEGARWLELACVNPYDLASYMNNPDLTYEEVLEMFDVGGPAMMNAAIKGQRVLVTSPDQYPKVLEWLDDGRPDDEGFRQDLYVAAGEVLLDDAKLKLQHLGGSAMHVFVGKKVTDLKYGTNPHQKEAELYTSIDSTDPLSIGRFEKLQGTELSATNVEDIYYALTAANRIAAAFERNYAEKPLIGVGGKHTNPCGAAVGETPAEVITKTLESDLLSIHGGALMFNFPIDGDGAELLLRHMVKEDEKNRLIDVVSAPGFTDEALGRLKRLGENKLRLMVNPALADLSEATMNRTRNLIGVGDSVVVEDPATFVWDMDAEELKTYGFLNMQQERDGMLAWAVGSMTSSNTMTAVKDGMVVANSGGQQSRVDAARVAIARAKDRGHDLTGATIYTDSFMPFRDAVDEIVNAGFGAIIGTVGSVNSEAMEAIKESEIAFISMPDALARGFRH